MNGRVDLALTRFHKMDKWLSLLYHQDIPTLQLWLSLCLIHSTLAIKVLIAVQRITYKPVLGVPKVGPGKVDVETHQEEPDQLSKCKWDN